jgi:hypothetical protein
MYRIKQKAQGFLKLIKLSLGLLKTNLTVQFIHKNGHCSSMLYDGLNFIPKAQNTV